MNYGSPNRKGYGDKGYNNSKISPNKTGGGLTGAKNLDNS